MRAARPVVALAAALLIGSGLGAADRQQVEFSPAEFGAGEEVEAVLVLPGLDAASGFSLKAGSSQLASDDPELRELSLSRSARGWELRVRFVPWSPGTNRVPSISARGVVLPSFPYSARSSAGAGAREIAPPRPQREPPGTALYLYGIAGAALLAALAAIGSVAYLLPAARSLVLKWKAGQAFRRLCKSLEYLEGGAAVSEPAAFYAALSRSLRLYLAERVLEGAPCLTAAEFARLPSSAFPASGLRDAAALAFSEAERARYAGESPGTEAMSASVSRARELAAAAEEALDARV